MKTDCISSFLKTGRLEDVARYAIPDESVALELALQIAAMRRERDALKAEARRLREATRLPFCDRQEFLG